MKLNSFRIRNYKSIKDSGECKLSLNDKILILAGQNESGKSSILQALHDYERNGLREYSIRKYDCDETVYPVVECEYVLDSEDKIESYLSEQDITAIEQNFINNEFKERIPESEKQKIPQIIFSSINESRSFRLKRILRPDNKSLLVIDGHTIEAVEKKMLPLIQMSESEIKNSPKVFNYNLLANTIWPYTPHIIYFDDFCDLLPDRINVDDLINQKKDAKGYNAVKNIERLLNTDFTKLANMETGVQLSNLNRHTKTITANFNERWNQKIFEDNQITISINYDSGTRTLNFFILTKEDEYLTLQQRSNGLRWFLSFYFQLTAESKNKDELVILFDEPGLYLHVKAQKDIKNVFEELSAKDQIIYSTHSPYLIDRDKLHRLRLVINDKREGTKIEKITTDKVKGKKDALKPIVDAIGFDLAHDFSIVKKKNVIVEGPSDLNYFVAMKELLQLDGDYAFIPSMGVSNIHLLMEFCLGWDLDWLIIMDGDGSSGTEYNKIKKAFFDDKEDDVAKKIFRLKGHGIEDIFTFQDIKLAHENLREDAGKSLSAIIKEQSSKQLISQLFREKVIKQEIKQINIHKKTIENFKEVFEFIDSKLMSTL